MQTQLVTSEVLPSLVLGSLIAKEGGKKDWKKPADWSDMRKDCPANSIALYAGHTTDYSQYDNLGFMVTCIGGYNVFIDGNQYPSKNLITNDIDGQGTYISPSDATTTRIYKSLANIPLGTYTLTITGDFEFIMQKKIGSTGENIGSWSTTGAYTFDDASATYGIAIRKTDNSNIMPSDFNGTLQLEKGSTATTYEPYGLFASGTQCSITWSTSGITTGDDITTPSALKAHKIWIEPATEGNDITAFACARVAASGNEQQGVLWGHFNISNTINLYSTFTDASSYSNSLIEAVTAKNNVIKINGLSLCFYNCSALEYVPALDGENNTIGTVWAAFYNTAITKLNVKNFKFEFGNDFLNECTQLTEWPKGIDYSDTTNMRNFLVDNTKIKDVIVDVSAATGLKTFGVTNYGATMTGFKGLRVSNQAPFDDATAPQINVSYTGMDRNALVTLFNDLPTVTGGQIINITGCTGSEDLLPEDIDIATNKGWTITGGPAFRTYYAYTNNDTSIYVKDNPVRGSAWEQPALTGNGTMGGDTCAVESSINQIGGAAVWYGFDNNVNSVFHSPGQTADDYIGYFTYYSPIPICVTKITFRNQGNSWPSRSSSGGTIYGSNDNSTWTTLATYTHSGTEGTWDIDVSTNTNYYKYYKLYSDGVNGGGIWSFSECKFTATQIPSEIYNSSLQLLNPQPTFTTGVSEDDKALISIENGGTYIDYVRNSANDKQGL